MADNIEKWLKPTLNFLTSVALPASITLIGIMINNTIAEKDRSLHYIDLATNLLKTEQNPDVRDWAVDVINHYSDVKMSVKAQHAISGKLEAQETGQDNASMQGHVSPR